MELKSFSESVRVSKTPLVVFKKLISLDNFNSEISNLDAKLREKFDKELSKNFADVCDEIVTDLMVRTLKIYPMYFNLKSF